MFASLRFIAGFALAAVAVGASSLERRSSGQVLIGCYPGGAGGCPCPTDLNGDSGVLINVFPGYQCAYPSGACAWAQSGQLQDVAQGNCPSNAPCATSGCDCVADLNGDSGILINAFEGYQCAYPNGACTWDQNGELQNVYQGNCPATATC